MLTDLLDIFRLRQYFNLISGGREWVRGLREACEQGVGTPAGSSQTPMYRAFDRQDMAHDGVVSESRPEALFADQAGEQISRIDIEPAQRHCHRPVDLDDDAALRLCHSRQHAEQ